MPATRRRTLLLTAAAAAVLLAPAAVVPGRAAAAGALLSQGRPATASSLENGTFAAGTGRGDIGRLPQIRPPLPQIRAACTGPHTVVRFGWP